MSNLYSQFPTLIVMAVFVPAAADLYEAHPGHLPQLPVERVGDLGTQRSQQELLLPPSSL